MRIAILGFGQEGQAAYDYWRSPDNQLVACDQNEAVELPSDVARQLGPDYLKNLDGFDVVVRSPGIAPSDIVAANSPGILTKVTTGLNEFFRVCPTKNIIGITGTKGKGTTSTLIAKMLEAAGKTVHLGGNIGVAPLDVLKGSIQPDDWVVLELSSFQLIDLAYSPHIAVCLMVVPEHLNWHADMDEYVNAKRQLFAHQTVDDLAIYFSGNEASQKIASASPGRIIPYSAKPGALVQNNQIMIDGQIICRTSELKLLGQHNWQNVCAAVTAVWFSLSEIEEQVEQNIKAMHSVLTAFTGLPHRLELVREVNGVQYYDDSFGTTPETAIVAIRAFAQPKVIILGGSDKGATFDELTQAVAASNVRTVVLIGDTGPAIKQGLRRAGYEHTVDGGTTMHSMVAAAKSQAQSGDVVLLSTGCASFGLFQNYKDRAQQFNQAVQALTSAAQ